MTFLNSVAKFVHKTMAVLLIASSLIILPSTVLAAEDQTVEFSQAELDQMLAPIALYPDALLSQVLIASTYPLEIIQADRWVRSNNDLKSEDALKFAENKDWDPSVKALVAFPDVLKRMSEDVDWTQRLGDAFLSDEKSVMDAVQRLRKRAYATGNLEKAQHISIERDDDNIIIEPAQERIVYVPVYDTRVVYGNWWWPDYPPVYWHYPSNYTYVSGFYWGTSIYLGSSYFYSSCRWRDRRVVVIDRPYHGRSSHFYTGRTIVHHRDARVWRHDPGHRHGVAYYNNNLRSTYGSRHDSYQNDRHYRQQHPGNTSRVNNDWNRDDNRRANRRDETPGANRSFHNNSQGNGNGSRNYDRSEQLRDRLHSDNTVVRPWRGDTNARANGVNTSGLRAQTLPQATDNNNPSRAQEMQNHRSINVPTQALGTDVNASNRGNRERRIVTDNADQRPNSRDFGRQQQRVFTAPSSVDRPVESPRREFTPNRGGNGSSVQVQPQPPVERQHHTPRFARDRGDDK